MRVQLIKRSFSLSRHRTSVALEQAFWDALEALAAEQGRGLIALLAELDAGRPPSLGLASVLRLSVLKAARGGKIALPSASDGVGGYLVPSPKAS